MALAAGTPLYLIGYSADGAFGCVQNVQGTIRGYIPLAHLTNTLVQPEQPEQQPSALEQLKAQVTMVDWYDTARYALERGAYYMLYDIRNGQTINIKYTTGSSHMDHRAGHGRGYGQAQAGAGAGNGRMCARRSSSSPTDASPPPRFTASRTAAPTPLPATTWTAWSVCT